MTRLRRTPAPLDLFLIARSPAGDRRAVSLRMSAERPASELVAELATRLGVDAATVRLQLGSRPQPIDCSRPVGSLGLRIGHQVWLVPAGRPEPPAAAAATVTAWELAVVGGPLAGRCFRLPAGDLLLGRAAGSDIRLPDPGASRRHLRLHVGAEGVTLTPAGAACTLLDGRPLVPGHRAAAGDVLEVGHSLIAVRRARTGTRPAAGRVAFNRPPAGAPAAAALEVRLPQPPADLPKLRLPLAAVLAPLVIGLAIWVAARSAVGLLFALGTPLMAVGPALEDRLVGRWHRSRQRGRFQGRLAAALERLAALRARESRALRAQAPDPGDLEARVRGALPTLWERRPDLPGFLRLRLGWGDAPSAVRAELAEGGREELRAAALAAVAAGAVLRGVPVSVDLGAVGALGLAGPPPVVTGLARWLLVQAAALHSPLELQVAALLPDGLAAEREWLRRLPHVRGAGLEPDVGQVPDGPDSQRRLAIALRDLAARAREAGLVADGRERVPGLLLLVHEDAPVERGALVRLLREGPAARIFVIWCSSEPNLLPDGCRAVAELASSGLALRVRDLGAGAEVAAIPDLVDRAYAGRVAGMLAGIEDTGAAAGDAIPPDAAGLIECLVAAAPPSAGPDLPALLRRWWASPPGSLAAPVGAGADGIVTLDLREDGPHALVGGTSGSGKSEFLRAWVTALAALHPPTRVSFLLVDFKGGTAFQDCARLPHVVGVVTDLDEHLLARVRHSLLAELKRREARMAELGQKEFADFERTHPDRAFPVLVVVFDEFEQLLAEQPAFVSEVIVPIARLGRGLGVHLVLGTQKPQGSVPEAIRSNTNIRVALRMLSEAQSRDVIDAPDAARIPPAARGRAHLRLSHRSLAPLQVAFAGARGGADGRPGGGPTDFERLVEAVAATGRAMGLAPPARPWLPPLPEALRLDDLPPAPGRAPATAAPIGLVDEPGRQAQWTLTHDLAADGHLLVHGAARSGKSTLLRTLAVALARAHSPSALWIYGLDLSSGALRSLEALPHVGGVAGADDPERVVQLLRMLSAEVSARRRLLRTRTPTTWRDLGLPAVLLLVDEHATFGTLFERVDGSRYLDLLDGLVRDGRAVGVHCAISTSSRRELSGLLASAITRRLFLRPDREGQDMLGVPAAARLGAGQPPGRGLLDGRLEVQLAVLAGGGEADEDAAVRAAAARLGAGPPAGGPRRVEVLPDELDARALPDPAAPLRPPVGLGGDSVAPLAVDLLAHGHLLVCGPRGSGRSTCLATIAVSLRRAETPARLVLLAGRRHSELTALAGWSRTALGPDACRALAAGLAGEVAGEPPGAGGREPTVVVVDDAELLTEGPCDAALRALARLGRDAPLRLVAAVEVRALRRYSEWLSEVRESRHGILLSPEAGVDAELFGGGPLPRPLRPYPPGRGFLLRSGEAVPVQVAR